jgi:hypothetical protein
MRIPLVLVVVLALGAGFGAGWVARDASSQTRTVVVQHKKTPAPCNDILDPCASEGLPAINP